MMQELRKSAALATRTVSATMELQGARVIHRNIFHNDHLVPIEKSRLSPGQAGTDLRLGHLHNDAIFRGEAFAYERHWRRLEKDAGIIRSCRCPIRCGAVRVNLHEVIRANKVSEGAARVYLVYNNVGFWRGPEEQPDTDLIICTARFLNIANRSAWPFASTVGTRRLHLAA